MTNNDNDYVYRSIFIVNNITLCLNILFKAILPFDNKAKEIYYNNSIVCLHLKIIDAMSLNGDGRAFTKEKNNQIKIILIIFG